MYCLEDNAKSKKVKVQLLGSGPMLNEVYKAAEILKNLLNQILYIDIYLNIYIYK